LFLSSLFLSSGSSFPLCFRSFLIDPFQHRRRNQLFLDMPFDALGQKAAKVGSAAARPGIAFQAVQRRTKHLCHLGARIGGNFRAGQSFVVDAKQPVGQRMKLCLAAVQHRATHHTGMQVGQQSNKAHNPEIKICQRHPDGIGFQMMDHGQREAEDIVTCLAVGQ
jgi:hypothetical protein